MLSPVRRHAKRAVQLFVVPPRGTLLTVGLIAGLLVAFQLAALWSWVPPAAATTLIRMSTKELSLKADAIFYGICEAVEEAWNSERTKILTKARFSVREVLKGELGAEVTVSSLGGRVGDLAMLVPASPKFKAGEEAVLFLWQNPEGAYFVLGMVQGKKDVLTDPSTSGKYLSTDSGVDGAPRPGSKRVTSQGLVPLAAYLEEIRSYLARQ
ncbi:MAG: hypothetical protein HYY96_04605 [Candidatus Tectomicrobia bacterium]|nr:hypothetical protein [Candidatus Tectomicrobia bacterium]